MLLRPVYTGDFCRATRCNFCLAEVARPVYTGDFCRAAQCNFCRAEVASSFEQVRNLMQLLRDKNCIELRDKNRLCKRALQLRRDKNCIELRDKNRLCKRAFTVVGLFRYLHQLFSFPKNILSFPKNIRLREPLDCFKKQLKTQLFSK